MRSGDIESVTAGVNNRIDAHALANILEIAPAQDRHRQFSHQRAENCPHRVGKHSLLWTAHDRRQRPVVIEKNGQRTIVRTSDFLNVIERTGNHT